MLLRHRVRLLAFFAIAAVGVAFLVRFEDVVATMALLVAVVAFQAVEAIVSHYISDFTFGPMDAFALFLSVVIVGGLMLAEKKGWLSLPPK